MQRGTILDQSMIGMGMATMVLSAVSSIDQSMIGMGMATMVLSAVSSIDSLMPVGVGSVIIGMNGLEATRIRDYIKKLHEED